MLIFLGLGWPWVGEFVGFIVMFICFPTQHIIWWIANTLMILHLRVFVCRRVLYVLCVNVAVCCAEYRVFVSSFRWRTLWWTRWTRCSRRASPRTSRSWRGRCSATRSGGTRRSSYSSPRRWRRRSRSSSTREATLRCGYGCCCMYLAQPNNAIRKRTVNPFWDLGVATVMR